MQSSQRGRSSRVKKGGTAAIERVYDFVRSNVFDVDLGTGILDSPVLFFPTEDETLYNVCHIVDSEYPTLLNDFDMFLTKLRFFYFSIYLKTRANYTSGVDEEKDCDHKCRDEPSDLFHGEESRENVCALPFQVWEEKEDSCGD